jgi:hypothetical protein
MLLLSAIIGKFNPDHAGRMVTANNEIKQGKRVRR